MVNFDATNSVNPLLVEGAIISYNNKPHKVVDMTKNQIIIQSAEGEVKEISDKDWTGIKLDEQWLTNFNLRIGSAFYNPESKAKWVLKTTGHHFYITIENIQGYGENPVVGIKTVDELQAWYFRLTRDSLLLE